MDVSTYKRKAMKTVAAQQSKVGIRVMLRKQSTVNLGHAILGLSESVGEVRQVLNDYILGIRGINDVDRINVRDAFGYCFQHLVIGSKYLGVKLPGSSRKIKLMGTPTSNLLKFSAVADALLHRYRRVYFQDQLGPDTLYLLWTEAAHLLYGLCWQVLNESPASVMALSAEKIDQFLAELEELKALPEVLPAQTEEPPPVAG